ncbi:ABC transporter substrate-binding protein [Chenggangzhangella methanolivorans]|uniref:Putative aliphatic sulfonates-binding protein n=1 Tax=Chenggangzhangella methanolivorans TaxID=1437009 RepID=A0A9E6RD98_9HYPH|nr:ABC transporter substrate-binding protein [Chenggangzhangella methanolivorans]QZO01183.1 ABC transporter substrate-binding protein [Chenggangzhangella methanolivorans]
MTTSWINRASASLAALALAAGLAGPAAAESLTIGVGTQDGTTNTVTTGAVIRELKLFEKHMPKTGKYAGMDIRLEWQNFTSGPPVTNGMMANKLQFGAMGDYPLVVNGFTFQNNAESKSQLITIAAYNIYGSGNGVVVHKDSPYFALEDLKGKVLSVPFGSAAHGMVLKAMQDAKLPKDFFQLVSQSPEVGSTNLKEQKIDAHADFVPFAELLPFRGFARKIFDGVQTNLPTFHGVVVRTDFAEKYPELVDAYLQASLDAAAWVKEDPKRAAEMISKWTGTDKEVVYVFLGPGGIMTVDPTIKKPLIDAAKVDVKVLQDMGRMKEFDVDGWVNDGFIRAAFKARGLDYDSQLASTDNYEIKGEDGFCKTAITEPRKAGEIWVKDGDILPFSSAACTLGAYRDFQSKGTAMNVAYVFDTARGIKLFADKAFYVASEKGELSPFMLKADAEAFAKSSGGKMVSFDDALAAATKG